MNDVDTFSGRVRVFEIEGRRCNLVTDRQQRKDRLDSPRCTEQMPGRRLGRCHGNAVLCTEQRLDRSQLTQISHRSRSCMSIQMLNLGR
ncbi:hypothetical protein D3C78_1584550 [compost metagenome]